MEHKDIIIDGDVVIDKRKLKKILNKHRKSLREFIRDTRNNNGTNSR
ncbi:hypothetical protein P0C28_11240 [Aeromonas hydrophila]|nr:hypothetical protein [Aeromonas hydrophila]MDE8809828.1 hypothetical protein [Aeromonas hydrophila]